MRGQVNVDVGQGDCTLVVLPGGKSVLVDCGTTGGSRMNFSHVQQFVKDKTRKSSVDLVVLSHPDKDHYSMIPDLFSGGTSGLTAKAVRYTGMPSQYTQNNMQSWLSQQADCQQIVLNHSTTNPTLQLLAQGDDGVGAVYLLAAGVEASQSKKNAGSAVLLVDMDKFEAFLPADATGATNLFMLQHFTSALKEVEVYKLEHHGAETHNSNSRAFIQVLRPSIAVGSSSIDSVHGHPRKIVIERLLEPMTLLATDGHFLKSFQAKDDPFYWNAFDKAVFTTASNGIVSVYSDGQTWSVNYAKDARQP